MASWFFQEVRIGEPERSPRETEFFRITSPGEAVVREFIQNSLDARKENEIVNVKISFRTIPRENINRFLDETLEEHLIACDLIEGYPEDIKCLVIEDFGTTGLNGSYEPDARGGDFYNFWWREGISQKVGQQAGRWGLGKITFHIVSQIRTMWGLTVRDDQRRLLMGKALLRPHSLNNKRYHYYGYFCENGFRPVEDSSLLQNFQENFGISRNDGETGLSIVIPMPVDEINFDSILKGILRHYYYPILAGMLKVEIMDNQHKKEINNQNLIDEVSQIDWIDTEWEGINVREILECVKNALSIQPESLEIMEDQRNLQITQQSFGNRFDTIKQNFLKEELVKVKVPLNIRKKDKTEARSFFTIILKKFSNLRRSFEGYIRSGILISEIKMLGNRPVVGLLIAEDLPLCEFLGDCETPAHTNWNERTEGFSEKYVGGVKILRFIKKSISQLVSLLDEPPRERQKDFLIEIFSIPDTSSSSSSSSSSPPPSPPPGRPPIFNISPLKDGFKIALNQEVENIDFPFQAIIKIAYDTRGGDPFGQYDKFDFDVSSNSINIESENCEVLSRRLNEIKIEIKERNFSLKVRGFDTKRDLIVDIKKYEENA